MFNIMTRYNSTRKNWTEQSVSVWAQNHSSCYNSRHSENIGSLELTFQFISALQNHTEDTFSIQIWPKYRHEKTSEIFSPRWPVNYFQSISLSLSLSVAWLTFSVVHSYWSRNVEARLSLVESFRVLLAPAVLCHREPARSKQNTPQWGYFAFPSP